MYIKRNHSGEITAISKDPDEGFHEQTANDSDELLRFVHATKSADQLALEQTDQTMARVLEDVVNLLVEQGIIRFTDLPEAAQQKLLTRRELRGKRQSIYLLDDDEHLPL